MRAIIEPCRIIAITGAGKYWDNAEKAFKLSAYEKWPGYASGLPFIARRYCGLWGRGT